jgi:Ca2+-binding EF-hand superfamily protein
MLRIIDPSITNNDAILAFIQFDVNRDGQIDINEFIS